MRSPIRPVPEAVLRWRSRLRWLRCLDGVLALAGLWAASVWVLGPAPAREAAVVAAILLGLGLLVRPLRTRWRPVSGSVGLAVSRGLRPGDRAWYVRPGGADVVLVTACHGVRAVIARPDLVDGEGLGVRRTRVLLLPADAV